MKTIKQLLTTIAVLLCNVVANAHDFKVDGIYYNITSTGNLAIEVTYKDSKYNSYSGNIVIPETVAYNGKTYRVTSIGQNAFYKCTELTNVILPNSIVTIGKYAFSNCSKLTNITIPNNVTSIGDDAFENCKKLTSVNISDITAWCNIDFNSPYSNPLYNSRNLYLNGEKITDLIIPEGVDSIKDEAFRCCESITSVTIPNSVTYIGEWSFVACSSLTSVTIPNSVTYIGDCAFRLCSSLTSIIIPNSVTYINNDAFSYCSSLTSITIPNSVTGIGNHAFDECSSLTSITIPNSVTSIGSAAFSACSSLTSISIPNSVTSIGNYAFSSCDALTTITWDIKNYTDSKYNNNIFPTSITSFTFGDSVEHIPSYLCYKMEDLTSIKVKTTTPPTLGENAFNSEYLKSVYIPDNTLAAYKEAWGTEYIFINNEVSATIHVKTPGTLVDEIVESDKRPINIMYLTVTGTLNDDDFICIHQTMTSLVEVDLYGITNTTGINFRNKTQLQKAILPQGLTEIEERTFANCSTLTSITIPSQVNSIGVSAFMGCTNIDTITCLGLTPPSAENLGLNPEKCVLTISKTAYKNYLKHNYWGQFLNIKTIDINYKTLSVIVNNEEWGTITGAGAYIENEEAILTATANDGYKFKEWSDGNTDNPRIIVVTEDIELTAIFEEVNTPVENTLDNQIGIYTIDGTLHIEGLESDYQIYTTTGQFIYSGKQTTLTLPRGIYLIVINGKTHKIAL